MSDRNILEAYRRWRDNAQDSCVILNLHTDGSTYTKPGAMMLVNAAGEFSGLISGGCLEHELVAAAMDCMAQPRCQLKTYNMLAAEDDVWGGGSGCRGLLRLLFIPSAVAQPNYLPDRLLDETLTGKTLVLVARAHDSARVGEAFTLDEFAARFPDAVIPRQAVQNFESGQSLLHEDRDRQLFFLRPKPLLRFLILGGGPDSIPLVQIAKTCNWHVTLMDHRKAYITEAHFPGIDVLTKTVPEASVLPMADAALVKSHRYDTDLLYLRQLAQTDIPYIGLLGPVHRRDRMQADLGDTFEKIASRLYGPAGINIKSYDPASIAVSVIAQIMLHFFGSHRAGA